MPSVAGFRDNSLPYAFGLIAEIDISYSGAGRFGVELAAISQLGQ
jgi:hypothetical protein